MFSFYLTEEIQDFNKNKAEEILKQNDKDIYFTVYSSMRNYTNYYKYILKGMTNEERKEIEELAVKTAEIYKRAQKYVESEDNFNRLKPFFDVSESEEDIRLLQSSQVRDVIVYFMTAFSTYFYMNVELADMSQPPLELAEAIKTFTDDKETQKYIIDQIMPYVYRMFGEVYYEEAYEMPQRPESDVKKEYDDYGLKLKEQLGIDKTEQQPSESTGPSNN